MDSLLPVAQLTMDLVVIPRWKQEPVIRHEKDVDVMACLELLYLASQGCINKKEHHLRFWRLMRIDLALCLLSHRHPVKEYQKAMQLLSMSVTRDSFGPRATDLDAQKLQGFSILDRLTQFVSVLPPIPEAKEEGAAALFREFRLQILQTLESFCRTPFGIETCAMHRWVIGRLAKFISDELDTLYDYNSGHKQRYVHFLLFLKPC